METINSLKKCVYTLCVNNYLPELCELSIPNHEAYAKKIGADFKLITERKHPDWPATYEKIQIYEQGLDYDWNIHIDADMLIHPDLHDVTKPELSTVYYYSIYDPRLYFPPNLYFLRDGRLIGICSSFIAVPSWCHDLWEPFSVPFEIAKQGLKNTHGIDDYCFSINFARYGLKGDFFFEGETPPLWQVQHLCVGGEMETRKEAVLENAKTILKAWEK